MERLGQKVGVKSTENYRLSQPYEINAPKGRGKRKTDSDPHRLSFDKVGAAREKEG